MPGLSRRSRVVDVDDGVVRDDVLDRLRVVAHLPHVAVERAPGYASTVKVTGISARIFPTSASATFVSTCMRVRSCAIVKSVGAWSVAATV